MFLHFVRVEIDLCDLIIIHFPGRFDHKALWSIGFRLKKKFTKSLIFQYISKWRGIEWKKETLQNTQIVENTHFLKSLNIKKTKKPFWLSSHNENKTFGQIQFGLSTKA